MKPTCPPPRDFTTHFPARLAGLLGLTCGLLLAGDASAQLHRTSQIIGFSSGNLGAVGGSEGWSNSSGEVTVVSDEGSLDGTALGLVPSAGDKVNVSAVAGTTTRNQFVPGGTLSTAVAQNVYYSFLYRFNAAADVSPEGEQIVMVNRGNSGATTGLHFEVLARSSGEQIQLGVVKPGGAPVYATTNIAAGETILVVVRQQMIVGAADDIIDLWINPPLATLGLGEEAVPEPAATTADGTEDASGTGPGRFWVASGPNASFDEFRVASTWAQATPTPSQCTGPSVSDPLPVTVTAGISATFSVTAEGTAAIYEWQVSTDDGETWIPAEGGTGGATDTYTTPNLTLEDNGKQYRVMVSVDCGEHPPAVSGPALVTVEAPLETPLGVLVDDDFSDGFRNDSPVTSVNSVWHATGGSLDASTGVLIGTPAAGSSRLWIGYFTDDLNTFPVLPAHLAVGRALKITMVFSAENIVANGGNSMRIGLFDYADGGTRVAADNFSGSAGSGQNVRGYMLSLNFGTAFSANEPMDILVRNNISDVNLMGTTGLYQSLGSGPDGAMLDGQPAFQSGVPYTLEFTVTRTSASAVTVRTSISGGGEQWTHSVTDETYAYHRFDAFALRANTLESTADSFHFTRFKAEILEAAAPATSIGDFGRIDADAFRLTWDAVPGRNYHVLSRDAFGVGGWVTNATVTATESSLAFTNSGLIAVPQRFYQIQDAP